MVHGLVPLIQPPAQFIPQCLQEIVFVEPDKVHHEIFTANRQEYVLVNDLPAGIQGTYNIIGTAFHLK